MKASPKAVKQGLRQWAAVAHDRALASALRALQAEFGRWERGEITAVELNEVVHRFHDGPSRDIWKTYTSTRLEPAVAFAIANGILRREEIPPDLVQHLSGLVEFYEAQLTRSADAVYQFRITLVGVRPKVWRLIQVPTSYSFWDLHVAIQDAMGWQDCHLHEFQLGDHRIGIPDSEGPEEHSCLPGKEVAVSDHMRPSRSPFLYLYDFGDDWEHQIEYEGRFEAAGTERSPTCLDGAGACPPEDCGGAAGYKRFLAAMRNLKHPEHKEMSQWYGGPFNPDAFDPAAVTFDDPEMRWKNAFSR